MVQRVNIGGPAHLYANGIPSGAMVIGTVERKSGAVGALVRYPGGTYAQLNSGVLCPLDRQSVIGAMVEARLDQVGRSS